MGLFLNTNLASLFAIRQFDIGNDQYTRNLMKLSSGKRILTSKDDPAGMAIATNLTTQIRGNDMGIRNANDAISMAQTAESALTQVINNLQRSRELAVQATSSALTDNDRSKLQTEMDQLTQEVSRIVQSTEFNGTYLLGGAGAGTKQTLTFQVGAKANASNQIAFDTVQVNGLSAISGGYNADLTATGTINISTTANSSGAISNIDQALNSLGIERARLGAIQNRFDSVISYTKTYNENLTAARSRIEDLDFAEAVSLMTKQQIMQQARIAMLAQANLTNSWIIQLLPR